MGGVSVIGLEGVLQARIMCSFQSTSFASKGSEKEDYSGISKVSEFRCTRTMDRACLK